MKRGGNSENRKKLEHEKHHGRNNYRKKSGDFLEDEDLDQINSLLVSDRFIRSIVGKESYSRWKNVFKDKKKKKK